MYWIIHKPTQTPAVTQSAKNLSIILDIPVSRLYRIFGKEKKTKYENDEFLVHKVDLIV